MVLRRPTTLLLSRRFCLTAIALAIAPAAAPHAFGQITVYGTTAASNSGSTYTAGVIGSGTTVRLDDGATISGASAIVVNGTFQYNQTAGKTLTISNTVSGTGALTLQNSGTLVLTGTTASTANGGFVLLNNTINANAGTLQIGPSGTNTGLQIGASGTGTLNVAGGVVTTVSAATAFQSLSFGFGNNSLGLLNVSSGTVTANHALYIGGHAPYSSENYSAGTPLVNGNATVNITGGLVQSSSAAIVLASGTSSNASVTISNTGTLGGGTFGNVLYVGITGTGTIDVNSGGLLRASQTYVGYRGGSVGTLNVNAGGYATVTGDLALCFGTGTGGVGSILPGGSHGTLNVASGGVLLGRGLSIVTTTTTQAGAVVLRTGTGVATISGTAFFCGFGAQSEPAGVVTVGGLGSGTASLVINSGGYMVASGTVSRAANGSITLNSGGTLQIGGTSISTSSTAVPPPIASTGNIGSGIAGALVGDLNFAGTLKFAQNGSSTYAGVLSGAGDVIKTGTGTVTLTGSNSYTGGTTLTAGFLGLGSANAIGTTGTLSFNGGAIQLTVSNTTDYSPRFSTAANQQYAVDTNGQTATVATNLANVNNSFRKEGLGTLTLTGTNAFTAITTGTNGGVLAGTPTTLATSGTASTGASSTIEMTVASGNASWGGQLVGSGTFAKLGAGTLTLTSVATGSTAGRLVVSDGAVIGTTDNIRRPVTNNASLTFNQAFTGTTSSIISGTGSVAVVGSGTVVLSGNNSYTGGTTVAAGAALEGTTATLRGNIANDGKVIFRTTNGTYSGTMSGSGVLEKYGTGNLTLTGSNTHTGGTVIGLGTITARTDSLQGAIENNALFVFNQTFSGTYAGNITGNSSGVVRLSPTNTGTITLTGSNSYGGGTEVLNGTLVGTTTSLQGYIANDDAVIFDQATDGTYAGFIFGLGTLTKQGGGTVNLTGSNSYAGATVVNGGGLKVNGSIAGSGLTVAAGATLLGTGTIGTNALIQGMHAPGNSPGLQTITGSLTYAAGAAVQWELAANTTSDPGTNYDQIVLPTGNLLFTGSTSLALSFDGLGSTVVWSDPFWDVNRAWMVFDLGAGTTTSRESLTLGGSLLDSLGNELLASRGSFGIAQSGQDVVLQFTAVPEPSTMALLGVAAAIGLAVRRRKPLK